MDEDVDSRDFDTKDFGSEDLDELIVYGEASAISGDDKPIPLDDNGAGGAVVSHAPLNLGGATPASVSEPDTIVWPARPRKPTGLTSSPERITGVKTFFAKLHPGAMDFLDEQITNWLRDNPGVVIKRTNATTGEVQAKKTEPNIIITVWY
ncbi:MAG: hypothetical protein ACYTBJ_18220 [Planctomycetota bacterium]